MAQDVVNSLKNFFGFEDSENDLSKDTVPQNTGQKNHFNLTKPPINKTTHGKTSRLFEIRIEEPRIYEDSLSIAAQLRDNTPVIINLKYLDTDTSKRLIDFVCGTAYAINGHMMKIGENIFIFTPAQVQLVNAEAGQSLSNSLKESEENSLLFNQAVGT